MVDNPQTTPDLTGIQRTADGTIADQKPVTEPKAAQTTDQTTTETKPATAKTEPTLADTKPAAKPGETLADDGKIAPAGPSEKYEFKAPEGYELDQATVDKFSPVFKKLGLTNEGAQELVDLYSEQALAAAEAPVKFYQDMREGWRKEVIADKTLGNGTDGLKADVKATIGRAIDSLGTGANAFREAMNLSGVGDHPAFIHAMHAFGKRLGEGRPAVGNGPSKFGSGRPGAATGPSAAALYPHLPNANS